MKLLNCHKTHQARTVWIIKHKHSSSNFSSN